MGLRDFTPNQSKQPAGEGPRYYAALLINLLDTHHLESVLTSTKKSRELAVSIQIDTESKIKKPSNTTFETALGVQAKLLSVSNQNEYALLLASLAMLESYGLQTNYRSVFSQIIASNLHKSKLESTQAPIGRDEQLKDALRLLNGFTKHLVILGENGVGKSHFARYLVSSSSGIAAFQLFPGTQDFLEQAASFLLIAGENKPVFFLDDVHSFSQEQISYLMENATVVATATQSAFDKLGADNPRLTKGFKVLKLDDTSEQATTQILEQLRHSAQANYGLEWEEGVVWEIYALSKRYMTSQHFPAKAIELLEESAMQAQIQQSKHISKSTIRAVVSRKVGLPVEDLTELDKKDLNSLADKLKRRVKGQEHAVDSVASVIKRSRLGLGKKKRPVGSFLFVGPSGVGKTELAKAVAEAMFGDEETMVRLDMSEYAELHTVQRLIGAPPGYIGYEEGGQLTNPIKAKPYNLVLLDEIEKAHTRVFDIFLQVLDDGRLTDGQGKLVDFQNTIVIATSNAGIEDILDMVEQGKSHVEIEKEVKEVLQDYFRIEFINRFDAVVLFDPLKPKALEDIARLQLERLQKELMSHEINLKITDASVRTIAESSYDPRYGARGLIRYLQDNVENQLAEMIINGQLQRGQTVTL